MELGGGAGKHKVELASMLETWWKQWIAGCGRACLRNREPAVLGGCGTRAKVWNERNAKRLF